MQRHQLKSGKDLLRAKEPSLPLSKVRELLGFLTADIRELHHVEVPRLAESLERFLALPDKGLDTTAS